MKQPPTSPWQDEFTGKSVIITGAAGIFGTWIAQAFAREGAKVVLSDMRTDELHNLERDLTEAGAEVAAHETQLLSDDSLSSLVDITMDNFGCPDILINNAGVYPSAFILDTPPSEWDRIMGVNVRAPYVLSRMVAQRMIEAGRHGTIINVSSGASRSMRSTMVPYCVSKTALDRLTKGLAVEFAEYKIRVNAVEPGFAPGSPVSPLTDKHVRATSAGIPLGRNARPDDATNVILFLCSARADFVTGATVSVDGGNSAGSRTVYIDPPDRTAPT